MPNPFFGALARVSRGIEREEELERGGGWGEGERWRWGKGREKNSIRFTQYSKHINKKQLIREI